MKSQEDDLRRKNSVNKSKNETVKKGEVPMKLVQFSRSFHICSCKRLRVLPEFPIVNGFLISSCRILPEILMIGSIGLISPVSVVCVMLNVLYVQKIPLYHQSLFISIGLCT